MKDFVIIENGDLKAKILLPENHRYKRTRFNHSGFISEVWYKGEKYTHYERSLNTGFVTTEGSGLCSQYEYNLIPENGEEFIRIGVGVMTKSQKDESYKALNYELEISENKVIIKAFTPLVGGFAYNEIREIYIENNELTEKITLINVGNKDIVTEEYCHNFISLPNEDISPNLILKVPVIKNPHNTVDGDFYYDEFLNAFTFKDYPNVPYYVKFPEVTKSETAWILKSKINNKSISEKIDFTPSRVAIWGYYYTVCCEIFKGIHLKPSESEVWSRRYSFENE